MRKNVDVNINIETPRDIFLLSKAYNIASNWMNKNNISITQL